MKIIAKYKRKKPDGSYKSHKYKFEKRKIKSKSNKYQHDFNGTENV